MRVGWHRVEEVLEVLVNERVAANSVVESFQFARCWEVAVNEKVGDFKEATLGRQLLDRVTSVTQDSLLTIDKRDCRFGCRGVYEALIESVESSRGVKLRDIDCF